LPIDEFAAVFKLPEIYCPGVTNESLAYQENGPKLNFAVKYDPNLPLQKEGSLFSGFLQSFKYFHPHAMAEIKNIYRFPGW